MKWYVQHPKRNKRNNGKAQSITHKPKENRGWKKAYVCLKPGQELNFAQEA